MSDVILKIEVDNSHTYENFISKVHEIDFFNRYKIRRVIFPVQEFRDEFIKHITEEGLLSLFNYSITMEDVTSPSMTVDDVESTVAKFVEQLRPLNNLLVIDPYFYAASTTAHELLQRLLSPHQQDLMSVTVICNQISAPNAENMQAAIKSVSPNASINEIQSKNFHDRFWINPHSGAGLVMGTSLNGIGRKIALVDRLGDKDVQEILELAKDAGYVY